MFCAPSEPWVTSTFLQWTGEYQPLVALGAPSFFADSQHQCSGSPLFTCHEAWGVGQPDHHSFGISSVDPFVENVAWLAPMDDARCAALSALLNAGGSDCEFALEAIRGRVVEFSFHALACRVVQLALSVCGKRAAMGLVQELRGYVRSCIGSPSANYVIQKVIEVMPASVVEFISAELLDAGVQTARHKFGCRILCRLLEHHATQAAADGQGFTSRLIDGVLDNVGDLCVHHYGHHVVESAIEHGSADHQQKIAAVLQKQILRYSTNRYGSHVVRKALLLCPPHDQQQMVSVLTSSADNVSKLADNHFGAFVLRVLLKMSERTAGEVHSMLRAAPASSSSCKKARRVLREFDETIRAGRVPHLEPVVQQADA
jgi:hypothetical protein